MSTLDETTTRVLDLVDTIPSGKVVSYGDVAKHLGIPSPRMVGGIMARHGWEVPWWRVIHSDGRPPGPHASDALRHWEDEDTPRKGSKVDMRLARHHL